MSPPVREAAVEPIPQEIEYKAGGPLVTAVDGNLYAGVHPEVLPRTERHLHLGQQAPARLFETEVGPPEDLEHRRPQASETSCRREAPSDRPSPEELAIRFFGIRGKLRSALCLKEPLLGQHTSEGEVRLEDRGAGPEVTILVSRRKEDLAACGEDGVRGVPESALPSETDVADSLDPGSALIGRRGAESDRRFPLVAGGGAPPLKQNRGARAL